MSQNYEFSKYSKWFYVAAIYNFIWGTVNILFPSLFFDMLGLPFPRYVAFWQVIGMFVLVYAPAYYWAGRHPEKYPQFIVIGLIGKIFGPIGFVYSYFTGDLPLVFGITILFNDIMWWPIFFKYLDDIRRKQGLQFLLLG